MYDRVGHKHLWLVIVIVIAIFAGFTGFVWLRHIDYRTIDSSLASEQTAPRIRQAPEPEPAGDTVTYGGVTGKSALELLETKETSTTLKESPNGPYVDSIKDKEGGENGKYWTLYINGQLAQKGAKDYITERGDKIEWKFE